MKCVAICSRLSLFAIFSFLISFPAFPFVLGFDDTLPDHLDDHGSSETSTSLRRRRRFIDNPFQSFRNEETGFQTRIVGGQVTRPGDYPFFARLNLNNRPYCGGVLVHPKYVLTAAHCDIGGTTTTNPGMSVSVNAYLGGMLGTNIMEDRQRVDRGIVRKLLYDGWKSDTIQNDFMVLELDKQVTYTADKVEPIEIVKTIDRPEEGQVLTVIGLGAMNETTKQLPDALQKVDVSVVSHERCNGPEMYNGRIDPNSMFCAGVPLGGKDACFGDSGGPIMDEHLKLVGLVSFGIGCARQRYPGVYARVDVVRDWIASVVCDPTNPTCLDPTPAPTPVPTPAPTPGPTPIPAKVVQSTAAAANNADPAAALCTNLGGNVIVRKWAPFPHLIVASCTSVPSRGYCTNYDMRHRKRVWEVCRKQCPDQSGCSGE